MLEVMGINGLAATSEAMIILSGVGVGRDGCLDNLDYFGPSIFFQTAQRLQSLFL